MSRDKEGKRLQGRERDNTIPEDWPETNKIFLQILIDREVTPVQAAEYLEKSVDSLQKWNCKDINAKRFRAVPLDVVKLMLFYPVKPKNWDNIIKKVGY